MSNAAEKIVPAVDPWSWWRNAIAGNVGTIHDGEPQTGYYRVRRKGKDIDSAVAYWTDTKTGEQRCHMDGEDFDAQRALEIWPYASKKPVSAEDYQTRLATGKWPNDHAAVVGHNQAPTDGSPEAIAERLNDLAREAEKLIAAGAALSQDICDQASDLANTFGEIEAQTKRLHKDEKEPHLEAGRLVDRKWFPLRDRADDLKARLKRIVVTPFLAKKDEDTRKAQIAAVTSGTAPDSLPAPKITAGSSKRSTGLRTYYMAQIEDKAKLLDSLKDHPDVLACIQQIANAAAAKKIALPGCKVIEEKRAA